MSAGNIPSSLESRVETKVKLLHSNTLLKEGKAATLGDNPPVTTPKSLAAFPTVSQPTRSKAAQDTKSLVLDTTKDSRGNVLSALYLIEAKVFVRFSGTKEEWIEAKTEHRQYTQYYMGTKAMHILHNMLEITYNKFIVAKGGDLTLKIKKKDNDMSAYREISSQIEDNVDSSFKPVFIIKTQILAEKQKLMLNPKNLASIIQDRFATTTIVQDYKYENDTYQIKLKNLQKNIFWRLAFVSQSGRPTIVLPLASIFVIE